ncbi:Armadillo repeat-containing protein 2 [Echinococcus granulosus]|uniref:Armadillo repeat containing protein 2 n=1 Tax=Echinococcus granulosus TaxID=6210 RepID=A0A068WEA0_ECHGR|nr:Armadillo repeat-containing protein 2 [Echinococcus granulosus]CDS18080.1 armadillo repeat containing protein 2 [Echinococcus granulosus]
MEVPSSHRAGSQSSPRPFYLPPSKQITPSAIVRECRDWLQTSGTRRPFTPRPKARHLFTYLKDPNSRPPTTSTIVSSDGEFTQVGSEGTATRGYSDDLFKEQSALEAQPRSSRTTLSSRCRSRVLSPIIGEKAMKVEGISCGSLTTAKAVQPIAHLPSRCTEQALNELLDGLNYATSELKSIDKSNANQGGNNAPVIVKKLFKMLDELHGLLTNSAFMHPTTKVKDKVIQTLLRVAAFQNAEVHFKVVNLGILLGPKDAKLVKICKIIYRVAKDAKNDEIFLQDRNFVGLIVCLLNGFGLDSESSLENLTTAGMVTTLESLLYTCGAVKFLTASAITREAFCTPELLHTLSGIHQALDLYSRTLNPSFDGDRGDSLKETVHHVLLQITEIFCVASSAENVSNLKLCIVETGVLQVVLKSLSHQSSVSPSTVSNSADFRRILLNWARTIAHATEHSFICQLVGGENSSLYCRDFVRLILLHKDQIDVVLRLAYALGNVAARCETARRTIFSSKESIAKMCMLCQKYAETLLNARPNSSTYDVLVKLTRVIANACVGAEGGLLAANTPECTSMLLRLLNISTTTELSNDELLNNSLAGLNNLTFYMTMEKDSELLSLQADVGQECIKLLNKFSHKKETSLNIVRVLGNLTRSTDIRASIVSSISSNLDDPCLIDHFWSLLKSCDEIVYSTLGVLINLMLEPTFLSVFRRRDGLQKMVDIMGTYAGIDWQTAALSGKVMCNFIAFIDSEAEAEEGGSKPLGLKKPTELEPLLRKLIDAKRVEEMYGDIGSGSSLGDNNCSCHQIWKATWKEEFLPVASHLLSLLNKFC